MGDLDELAARGKASEDATQAEAVLAEARRAKEQQLERHRQRWRALSAWGLFTGGYESSFAPVFFLLFAPLTVANILILVKLRVSDTVAMIVMPGHGRLYLPIPAVLLMIGTIVYARRAVRRAVVREAAMLASLPFEVTGFLECLGSYYRDNQSNIDLDFDFEGEPPRQLREILASDGGTWTVNGSHARRDPGPSTGWKTDNNTYVVRWFHHLIQKQLLPLHATYRFRSIRVTNGESHLANGTLVDHV